MLLTKNFPSFYFPLLLKIVIDEPLISFSRNSILLEKKNDEFQVLCGNCKQKCGFYYELEEVQMVRLERFRLFDDMSLEVVKLCQRRSNAPHGHHFVIRTALVPRNGDENMVPQNESKSCLQYTRQFRGPFLSASCHAVTSCGRATCEDFTCPQIANKFTNNLPREVITSDDNHPYYKSAIASMTLACLPVRNVISKFPPGPQASLNWLFDYAI